MITQIYYTDEQKILIKIEYDDGKTIFAAYSDNDEEVSQYLAIENNIIHDFKLVIPLEQLKFNKFQELEDKYSKSQFINIKNGFDFKIDLKSHEGDILLSNVKNAQGSMKDINLAQAVQKFFITITEASGDKQIYCNMYNWLWEYLFIEVLDYTKHSKQLKEYFKTKITNTSNVFELENLQIIFENVNGLNLNISEAIKYILGSSKTDIVIPDYIIQALTDVHREVFQYTHDSSLIADKIKNNLSNSFFTSWAI